MDMVFGIRVSPQEEIEGLDIAEHGARAYPGLSIAEDVSSVGHPVVTKEEVQPK